ncbi:rRNA methyltransferase 3, mitochondrial [Chionoecetes opilio]|uniref:rRNA methyltransferase 3, mitochondrial n=1 Tax=Chionoecetes opilio TaxID=41210 RepID=A0A8J4YB68_CHIOP|nr:rRNA methyltransferase 3, mitochondrial [Chionoecetes opilio]
MYSVQAGLLRALEGPGRVWSRGSRVFSRRPVRVHLKGPVKEAEDTVRRYEDLVAGHAAARTEDQQKTKPEQKPQATPSQDADAALRNGIRYTLLSEAQVYERKLLENMKSQKYRVQHQLFMAEGHRIIREAIEHGATPLALYFTRLKLVAALKAAPASLKLEDVHALSELPLYRADYKTLQTWSSVTTSPGIVGVFKIPAPPAPCAQPPTQPLTLVLDELREPGNLGGVLRTAAAVGATQVLLMKGCCDPWEAKVVRAGCGAHFRLTLTTKSTWNTLANHIPENAQIFLADVHRGDGASQGAGAEEDVAARQEEEAGRSGDSLEGNVYELDEGGNKVTVDPSYSDPQHLELYQHVSLPTLRYDRLGLGGAEAGAVLVIGGEVGVSNAAKKFVADNFGSQVTIPLANGMDSLNVGVASGVILYEMHKQLHEVATQRLWKERGEGGG